MTDSWKSICLFILRDNYKYRRVLSLGEEKFAFVTLAYIGRFIEREIFLMPMLAVKKSISFKCYIFYIPSQWVLNWKCLSCITNENNGRFRSKSTFHDNVLVTRWAIVECKTAFRLWRTEENRIPAFGTEEEEGKLQRFHSNKWPPWFKFAFFHRFSPHSPRSCPFMIISFFIPEYLCLSFSLLFSPYDEPLADEIEANRLFNFREILPFYFYSRDFIHFAD